MYTQYSCATMGWLVGVNLYGPFTAYTVYVHQCYCLFRSHLAISESKNDQLEKEVEILKQELLQVRQASNHSPFHCGQSNIIICTNVSPYRDPTTKFPTQKASGTAGRCCASE